MRSPTARCPVSSLVTYMLVAGAAQAAVLNVPAGYTTIQAAIDAAVNGDEIVVAPGTYLESINFNGKAITVRGSGGAAVTTIDGNNAGRAVTINNNEPLGTLLRGFAIKRGGVHLGGYTRVTIRDCVLRDNTGVNGAALTLDHAHAQIIDCTFRDNVGNGEAGAMWAWGNCQPLLRGCTFENNRAHPNDDAGNGGALRLDWATLRITVEDCVFRGNYGRWDGAVMIQGCNGLLRRCRFEGNEAGLNGGAVGIHEWAAPRIEDCVFTDNIAHSEWGGAVRVTPRCKPVFARCTFTGNQAPSGGAGWVDGVGTVVTVTDSSFADNRGAADGGGALRCNWEATLIVDRCWFTRNHGRYGGAIRASSNAQLMLTNSALHANSASEYGGAVLVNDQSSAGIADSSFSSNTSHDSGGAITVQESTVAVEVVGTSFYRNITSSGGGALDCRWGASATVTACSFVGNGAWGGGAVRVWDAGLVLTESYLVGNDAGYGGALEALYAPTTLFVEDTYFARNTASWGGGVRLISLNNPVLRNCVIAGNTVPSVGGGIHAENTADLRLEGCIIADNYAGDLGGGIAFWGAPNSATLANCTLVDNRSNNCGAGICFGNNGAAGLNIVNSILHGNRRGSGSSQIEGDAATVSYSLVEDGYPGTGNIDADPLLADRLAGDWRLTAGSPCIDQGNNVDVPVALVSDNEALPRVLDGDGNTSVVVDLGAYEYGNRSVLNVTTGVRYDTLPQALAAATTGQEIRATPLIHRLTDAIDPGLKAVTLSSTGALAHSGVATLPDGAELRAAAGHAVVVGNKLQNRAGAQAYVSGGSFLLQPGAELSVRADSSLVLDVPGGITLHGTTAVDPDAALSLDGFTYNDGTLMLFPGAAGDVAEAFANDGTLIALDATLQADELENGGSTLLSDAVLSARSLTNRVTGTFIGYGEVYGDVTNAGQMTLTASSLLVGDLLNEPNALIKVQIGTTTLVGQLTNYGTILGDFQQALRETAGTQPGDGLSVSGDYVAGPDAALLMANPVWRLTVAGDFDNAVTDHSRFAMGHAELRLAGAGVVQTLEVMSRDLGPDELGLDATQPGHFPIGTLHLGPSATVQLVDNRDNDGLGQAACEALYTHAVIIDAGATLVNPTCKVYYETLVNHGTVTHPANLQPYAPPVCLGDVNCDGAVTFKDIDPFVARLGCPNSNPTACNTGCTWQNADINGDGAVTFADIDPFVGKLGTICP